MIQGVLFRYEVYLRLIRLYWKTGVGPFRGKHETDCEGMAFNSFLGKKPCQVTLWCLEMR